MYLISSIVILVSSLVGSIIAQDTTPTALGTALGGALDPTVTPAPNGVKIAAAQVNGPVTIHVTNSFGSGLSISYGYDTMSPTALGPPKAGPLGTATQILYPSGCAGRIYLGRDYNPEGSKIEASFSPPDYQPNVDVSYVDGYTVPITCSCGGTVVSGCNINLFNDGHTCSNQGSGPICYNPRQSSTQASGTEADPFFEPCQGAAYTYPSDNLADSGCNTNLISCCVGTTCPAPARQHGKRSLANLIGGHAKKVGVDAV